MQATLKSKRITIAFTDEYRLELEYSKDYVIFHIPFVKKFNKSVYLDIYQNVGDVWDFVSTLGFKSLFAAVEPSNTVAMKLAERLGFIFLGEANGLNVYQFEEYLE